MLRTILAILLCLPLSLHASDTPKVLVTIKPVHSLVAALLEGITVPDLLLSGLQSPHNHQLKPSEAMRLYSADVIIWIGPSLESFLPRYLRNFHEKTIISLTHDDHDGPSQLHTDPHRWLDPMLAISDSHTIASQLSKRYPTLASAIRVNLAKLTGRLESLDRAIVHLLPPGSEISAILYHDAWHYFTRRYQLGIQGILNPQPHSQPGVQHLDRIQQTVKTRGTRCLLVEPQFKPRYLGTLASSPGISIKVIDPLGANEAAGKDAYFNMMQTNASVFAQCQ
jgi:zinc transport system substrate-binding protein